MNQDRSYSTLANYYDQLTTDVDYVLWAEYLKRHLDQGRIPVKIVVDLACGTGSLTYALAQMGYEMIGVDKSPEMLSEAMEKMWDFQEEKPFFLCQSMDKLDLYGTMEGCVCCLDSINYVTDPATLKQAFSRIFLFLAPGGQLIFDIKTPSCFQKEHGQMSVDESEDLYCVWRTEVEDVHCCHVMDLFQRQNADTWKRDQEVHHQRLYTLEELEGWLQEVGFIEVKTFGALSNSPPSPTEDRVFFKVEKPL